MPRTLRISAWVVAAAVAGLQAWAYRHIMNPDGLSYLDAARAFLAGDFDTAINPHWGPLYPVLLALGFGLARPLMAWVFPIVHLVNFAIFLVALAAFDWFLRELLRGRKEDAARTPALAVFAYAVFIYASLALIGLQMVTPDLCVLVSVFAGAALILRMQRRGPTRTDAVLLGLVLALGYFAKSVMFPIGLMFIAGLVLLPGVKRREAGLALATAGVVFFALCSMLIVPFSRETGSLTFGTAGKLAYNWDVNRVPYSNWQDDSAAGARPLEHPPRRVRSDPDVFEYRAHLRGTYPPWFDPAYWNAGVRVSIHPWKQALQLYRSTQFYVDLFLGSVGAVATVWVALVWLSADGRPDPGGKRDPGKPRERNSQRERGWLRREWPVLLPSLAALALYVPVHLETRYIAPFAALLWIVLAAAAMGTDSPERPSWFGRSALVAAVLLVFPIGFLTLSEAWEHRDDLNPFPIVAAQLHALGLRPGDRVANVGVQKGENFGSSFEGYWAYLAGVQIIAEIPEQRDFICRDAAVQQQVFAQLASLGARAVVTRAIPATACQAGWQPIDGTDFYVRLLPERR